MIIAFAGQKGGVGKSCAAICVAAELAMRGGTVLLADCDPQGTARTWHGLTGEAGLTSAPTVVCLGDDMPKKLPALAKAHDYTIIDSPPRHSEIQRAALMLADVIVLPCGGSSSDAWALMASLKLAEEARKVRPKLDVRILLTRIKPGTALGRGAREVLETTGTPVMRTEMRDRIVYQEAIGGGHGVTTFAPKSEAAAEVMALVDELTGTKGARRGR